MIWLHASPYSRPPGTSSYSANGLRGVGPKNEATSVKSSRSMMNARVRRPMTAVGSVDDTAG